MGALGVVDRAVGTAARAVRNLSDEVAAARQPDARRPIEERSEDRTTRIVVE
jgi:hypothetical protein